MGKFFKISYDEKYKIYNIMGLKIKIKSTKETLFKYKKHEKDIKKYKYVHLMNNGIHSVNIIKFINKYYDNTEHCFIFPCVMFEETMEKLAGIKNVYCCHFKSIKKNKVNKIIIHGLFDGVLVKRLYKNKHFLKKTYWFIWGGDLYSANRSVRDDFVRKNVAGILTSFDKEVYEEKYGTAKSYFDVTYPHDITDEMVTQCKDNNITHIQINNSADETTLDMLDILSKFKDAPIKITTILSYITVGQKDLRLQIMKKGYDIFGNKFNPIIDFMSREEYANH